MGRPTDEARQNKKRRRAARDSRDFLALLTREQVEKPAEISDRQDWRDQRGARVAPVEHGSGCSSAFGWVA